MSTDPEYVRHRLPLIFDVPKELAADRVRATEILNLVSGRMLELLESDARLNEIVRQFSIEWGWEQASWEE